MHFLGIAGMPRRIPDYPDLYAELNVFCSIGSLISFVGVLIWFYVVYNAFSNKIVCPKNPWTFYSSYPDLLIRLFKLGLRLQNKFYIQKNLKNNYLLDYSNLNLSSKHLSLTKKSLINLYLFSYKHIFFYYLNIFLMI
jgi:heme/copper-type cytochrome/quinol oxidase subunit 1